MTTFNIMLALLVLACFLLSFGFQFRDNSWGIAIMWLGAIVMLSTIAYKVYEITHLI